MPDGKPDRHILPTTSFHSGLRAGRAQERECALRAASALASEAARGAFAAGDESSVVDRFTALLRAEEEKAGIR